MKINKTVFRPSMKTKTLHQGKPIIAKEKDQVYLSLVSEDHMGPRIHVVLEPEDQQSLFDLLNEMKQDNEFFKEFKHGFHRKSDSFDQITSAVTIPVEKLKYFQVVKLTAEELPDPTTPLPLTTDWVFLLQRENQLYLVNTEEYPYCRYIAKVEIQ